jgi:hypothetical protein
MKLEVAFLLLLSSGATAFQGPPLLITRPTTSCTSLSSTSIANDIDFEAIKERVVNECKEVADCASIATAPLFQSSEVTPEDIVKVCDALDAFVITESLFSSQKLQLRRQALEFQRYELLAKLLKQNYESYIATASFLSPSRIPRIQLPNLQDVPIDKNAAFVASTNNEGLVPDCELDDLEFNDSILDTTILAIFRKIVAKNMGGVTSDKKGITGLLDQGRQFMTQPGQTAEAQHTMLRNSLGDLMTPVLPPFYRIFMSGIVPKGLGTDLDGKQFGPWFYAPFLTSFVTPTFFGFLVGPSYPNRRKDGELGGLVVEKCKFLQESGCKGLCLNMCKLPAQQFFKDELGLPLTVSPNFVTQECQWSFGEEPMPHTEDPSFPKGCLTGCESRKIMQGSNVELCS